MATGIDRQNQFADVVNKLLGSGTVRKITPQDVQKLAEADPTAPVKLYQALKPNLQKTAAPKSNNNAFQSGGLSAAQLGVKSVHDSGNAGIFKGLEHAAGKGLDWAILKPLEQLARPAKGIAGMATEGIKVANEKGQGKAGVFDILGAEAKGLWRGAVLNKNYSGGTVTNEIPFFKNFEDSHTGSKVSPLEGIPSWALPDAAEHWKFNPAKIPRYAASTTTDIAGDPLTYVGAGGLSKLSPEAAEMLEKAGVVGAAKLTGEDAAKALAEHAAREAVEQTPLKASLNAKYVSRWKGAEDQVVNEAANSVEKHVAEIMGGTQKGKLTKLNDALQARQFSQEIGATVEDELLKPTRKTVAEYTKGLNGGNPTMSAGQIAWHDANDPAFKAYHDVIKATKGPIDSVAIAKAEQAMGDAVNPIVEQSRNVVHGIMDDALHRIPTLRFLGKDVMEFPKVGRAIESVGKLARTSETVEKFEKSLSYARNFEGKLPNVVAKYKSTGNAAYEERRIKLIQQLKGSPVGKEGRRMVDRANHAGTILNGNEGALQQHLMTMRDEMFAREQAEGLVKSDAKEPWTEILGTDRGATKNMSRFNYKKNRDQFYQERRNAIESNGRIPVPGPDRAKQLGLRAEGNAVNNHLYKEMRHENDMIRQLVDKDFLTNFTTKSTRDAQYAHSLGLDEITDKTGTFKGNLVGEMKNNLKSGERLYMDSEAHDMLKKYHGLASAFGQGDNDHFLHVIDYLTKKFKVLNTIYFPGFHVKNFLSDVFLGTLDGVGTRDYTEAINTLLRRNSHMIKVGDRKILGKSLFDEFKETASSGGFLNSDVHQAERMSVSNVLRKTGDKARDFAENREDLGRFSHYIHAMKEEYSALIKKGIAPDKAWDKASFNALSRVNKYKFDYNQLTGFESGVMRRAFPFYTYTRKAMPLIAESMLNSPRMLSYTQRLQNSLQGNEEFQMLLPDWLREMGYARVAGKWGITDDTLPSATVRQALANPPAQANPLLQAFFELGNGTNTFTGDKLPGDNFINRLYAGDPSAPGPLKFIPAEALTKWRGFQSIDKAFGQTDKSPTSEKWLNFFGIPVRQVTNSREVQKSKQMEEQIKGELQSISDNQLADKGLHAYFSTSAQTPKIQVANADGNVVATFASYAEFKKALGK